jgi:hypothetical protein
MTIHHSSVIGMHRVRINNIIILRFRRSYLRYSGCRRCRSDQLAEIRLPELSDLFPLIFSATLKKSLQNDVEFGLHLLLQFFGEFIDVHGMVDVALMRDLGPIPSILTVASHVAGGKLDLFPVESPKSMLTLKIAPHQHTNEGLECPRGLTGPTTQQETERNRRNRSRDR